MTRRKSTLAALLLAALLALPRGGVAQTMSFEMHYRSVGTIDEMPLGGYTMYSISQSDKPGSSFTQSLQRPGRELTFYSNTYWSQEKRQPSPLDWLAVEWRGKTPQYLHIDLNVDGRHSWGERLKPGGWQSGKTWFVTPTHTARTEDGIEWPVRYFLTVRSGTLGCSMASFWEGRCTTGGTTYILRVSGDPPTNGSPPLSRNAFRLLIENPYSWSMLKSAWRDSRGKGIDGFRKEIRISRHTYSGSGGLRPLARGYSTGIGTTYYRCSVTTGTPPVVTVARDLRRLGDLELRVLGGSVDIPSPSAPDLLVQDDVSTSYVFSRLSGPENGTFYSIGIPEGRYRVRMPLIMRLTKDDGESRLFFPWQSETLPFEVKASTRTIVQIGYATGLHVGAAIDERYISPDADTARSCRQGQSVGFHICAIGKWGERFNYGEKGGTKILPGAIRVLAPDGNVVFEGPGQTVWDTTNVPPGKYTIHATYPIPPLHTEMKDEIPFEVKPAGPVAQGGDAR